MRERLRSELKKIQNFDEVLQITISIIADHKNSNPDVKIGYVAGKVTTDGVEQIKQNLQRLHTFTDELAKDFEGIIFSAADVFDDEVYWKINQAKPIHEEEFYDFWRKVVSSGVTDIFMTPEWERSTGASDEHSMAKKLGITIHYLR